jgi:long-subunit fatty acid transport protein
MKKVLFTLALMLTTMAASAQWHVGGGIGFSKTKDAGVETTQFLFTPEVGYNINDNWTVGATLELDWTKDVHTAFNIAPYARYTFLKAGNFSFFADGTIALGAISPEVGDSQFCWGIGVKPGIAYNFTDNVYVAAHVGWLGHRNYGDQGEDTAISVGSRDLSFSLYYCF